PAGAAVPAGHGRPPGATPGHHDPGRQHRQPAHGRQRAPGEAHHRNVSRGAHPRAAAGEDAARCGRPGRAAARGRRAGLGAGRRPPGGEPAGERAPPCAGASPAAAPPRTLPSGTVSAPAPARNPPTSRRARPRVAMTAARAASEATASAPANGTTACPLTVTVLPGIGPAAAVTTRAHPWWADSSTSRAPAAATPRTSTYSRPIRVAARGGWPAAAVPP